METIKNLYARIIEALSGYAFDVLLYKSIAVLLAMAVTWILLRWTLKVLKRHLIRYPFIQQNKKIFQIIRQLGGYLLWLAAGTYFIRLFNAQFIAKPFYALLILLCATPVKNFLLLVIQYLQKTVADKTATKMDNIIFDLLERLSGIIVYIIAGVLALDFLGVNVMPFIAGAGVMGIAVGFAAKDTLSNFIAGILLLIDRPFEIGDRIELWHAPPGSASWGDVVDIGLRATKIKNTDNIIIVIPNNTIMTRDIINYTANDSIIRVRVNIGVAYDTDIKKAKTLITDVAASASWILSSPEPKVVVRNFGESTIDMQLRVWISNARRRMDTISYITDHVKTAFSDAGIEIPYPKREIHMISQPSTPSAPPAP
ncbi:MAG: hypothetical protein DSY89_02725 [Deltaproteobacteria bacterium]|nr:MAG: hypothetical protein DSY89_02725 [Deltaproteobacteria bacterium]